MTVNTWVRCSSASSMPNLPRRPHCPTKRPRSATTETRTGSIEAVESLSPPWLLATLTADHFAQSYGRRPRCFGALPRVPGWWRSHLARVIENKISARCKERQPERYWEKLVHRKTANTIPLRSTSSTSRRSAIRPQNRASALGGYREAPARTNLPATSSSGSSASRFRIHAFGVAANPFQAPWI